MFHQHVLEPIWQRGTKNNHHHSRTLVLTGEETQISESKYHAPLGKRAQCSIVYFQLLLYAKSII